MERNMELEYEIIKMITVVFDRKVNDTTENDLDCQLTGYPFYLRAEEMLYLFTLIEKYYCVVFQIEDVIDYSFNSINSIVLSIKKAKERQFEKGN